MDLKNDKIRSLQSAVIRTNCIDCLDRTRAEAALHKGTNVVQSVFAKNMLLAQLTGEEAKGKA